jgi:hypothetical protein
MQDQDPDPPNGEVSRLSKVPPALSHGAYSTMAVLPGEDPKEFIELYNAIAAEYLPDGPVEMRAVITMTQCQWRASHLTVFQRAKWARAKYGPMPRRDDVPTTDVPATDVATTEAIKAKRNKLLDQAALCKQRGNVGRDAVETVLAKVREDVKDVARRVERTFGIERLTEVDLLDVPVLDVLGKEGKGNLNDLAKGVEMDLNELVKVSNDDYQLAMLGDVVTFEHLEKELQLLEHLEARHSRAMKTLMQSKAMKEILGTDPKSRATRTQLDIVRKTES